MKHLARLVVFFVLVITVALGGVELALRALIIYRPPVVDPGAVANRNSGGAWAYHYAHSPYYSPAFVRALETALNQQTTDENNQLT